LSALKRDEAGERESIALEIIVEAARKWRRTSAVRDLVGPRRLATREELIGRVLRAREMIDDLQGLGCDLDSLAGEACLSKFHFLRVFKEAFGMTPGQYARHVRVTRAREMEIRGNSTPNVARLVGYSRSSSLKRAQSKVSA
jgi:transcriptional regulator GlxA family with amidase domain